MAKFIFVTGGVVSSLGKGISAASLAALLQAHGYSIKLRKLDPYLNIDPGTMNPNQHGEVFVTADGGETDLDLGHYERFTGESSSRKDNITTGKIYADLLAKERKGEYLGATIQVIPHVTGLIKEFILRDQDEYDFIICEIGGTVGDIEGLPFFEAIRQLGYELSAENAMYVHLTLVPYLAAAKEIKTKPTQHSVKELRSIGIQPNILICRSEKEISHDDRKKIGLFCNIPESRVFQALDEKHIYNVPISYANQGIDHEILAYFGLKQDEPDIGKWHELITKFNQLERQVNIAIVGKYTVLEDSYKSLIQSLEHAGIANNCKVKLVWIGASNLTDKNIADKLSNCDAILVPGGFGNRGVDGKLTAIMYARKNNIPFFGICLGMQLATIEYARNVLGINDANSDEFAKDGTLLITKMSEWLKNGIKEMRGKDADLGGTMRLGHYPCVLQKDSKANAIFGSDQVMERHRHRYEFSTKWRPQFEDGNFVFAGTSPDNQVVEMIELKDHKWFVGCQFHPEFQSNPFEPHPLFKSFVAAALNSA